MERPVGVAEHRPGPTAEEPYADTATQEETNDQGMGRSYYRDDEIVVDRDGLPHYTGASAELLK